MINLKADALQIAQYAIKEVLPESAVEEVLSGRQFDGRVIVIAIGKAAWRMAHTASKVLGDRLERGVAVTKYHHSEGALPRFEIIEAGHPLPDDNSVYGATKAIEAASNLTDRDTVIFLVSGGGSALFEKPYPGIELKDIIDLTNQLLSCGADIVEINAVRKHLSAVKGGRFAECCHPAKVFSIVLSDVLGDRLDAIASGPAYPDNSTSADALGIINKYNLSISPQLFETLRIETPKTLDNVETVISGSVRLLCNAAINKAQDLGYRTMLLTTKLDCEAREAGRFLSSIAQQIAENGEPLSRPCAIVAGGETVVHLTGKGRGGRNQELALSAALGIANLHDTVVLSIGSDGTDGPTDAAGGIVDGNTLSQLKAQGIDIYKVLSQNDSYTALKATDNLIITGPTGTNVNDLVIIILK